MRRVAIVCAAAVTAAVGITTAFASDRRSSAQTPHAAKAGEESLAAFRRGRVTSDSVPRRLAETLPKDLNGMTDLRFDRSRLADADGGDAVYLIPKGARDVCMLGVFGDGTTSMACAPWTSASNAATPLVAMSSRASGVRTFGVLPDSVTAARLERAAGSEEVGAGGSARAADAGRKSAFINVDARFPDELVLSSPNRTETVSFDVSDQ